MSDKPGDPASTLFESAAKLAEEKRKLGELGFSCDPCDPLLPLHQPMSFYGEENQQFKGLIVKILEFVQNSRIDLLFLKGPHGSGKTIFAQIFEEYSQKLNVSATYQDATTFFAERALDPDDTLSFSTQTASEDLIFLDNAFQIHKILQKLLSLNLSSSEPSPKIIAIMDSTEFEIYHRLCIQSGDSTYRHFLPMPHFDSSDIFNLLQRRFQICYGEHSTPRLSDQAISNIANLSLGNPGVAIRILEESLRFSLRLEDLRFTFGINLDALTNFHPSKTPILREILVREIQNESLPISKQEYIIHKKLTSLMHKTKSTISHHLGDLLSSNLIYEQSTDRDKREKAYRPNKSIFGILEHCVFEASSADGARITSEGVHHED